MSSNTNGEMQSYWEGRSYGVEARMVYAQTPVDDLRGPLGNMALGAIRDALPCMVLSRKFEAWTLLDATARWSEAALASSSWSTAGDPSGSRFARSLWRSDQLGRRAQVLQVGAQARWLLGEPWPVPAFREAAALVEEARGGKLGGIDPPWQLHLWLAADEPAAAVALYQRSVSASKALLVPPPNRRFMSGQLNSLYLLGRHLAGDLSLAEVAGETCQAWLQRVRNWQDPRDDFQDGERLFWARLWSAHYGGPSDVYALIEAIRGF